MPHRHHRTPYTNRAPGPLPSAPDIQILVLGAPRTGKTALNARFSLSQFVDTHSAAQQVGTHRLVDIDGGRDRAHVIAQDFPCGPCRNAATSSGATAAAPGLRGDFIFAALQGEYRERMLERSDAVMFLVDPASRATAEWVSDGVVAEVRGAETRKYFGRRVELLLDGLDGVVGKGRMRKAEEEEENPAITIDVPGLEGSINTGTEGQEEKEWRAEGVEEELDAAEECEYPVLIVGAMADRLIENGSDRLREVWEFEGQELARRFGPRSRYMEVSAKSGDKVDEAYLFLVRQVLRKREKKRVDDRARRLVEAEKERRRRRRSCSYWAARFVPLPPISLASVLEAVADPVLDWFRPPPYAQPFSATDSSSSTGSRRTGATAEPTRPASETTAGRRSGSDPAETSSLPSLTADDLTLDYISIPDSYLFQSPNPSNIMLVAEAADKEVAVESATRRSSAVAEGVDARPRSVDEK